MQQDEFSWELRPATEADVLAMTRIEHLVPWGHWSSVAFSNELELLWSRTWVATTRVGKNTSETPLANAVMPPSVSGQVIAFVVYWMLPGEVELLNIAVHPVFQRRGVARGLLQHVLDDGRRSDAERVVLEVRKSNGRAQEIYERMGFYSYAVRKDYYAGNPAHPDQLSKREDAVLMMCDLKSS